MPQNIKILIVDDHPFIIQGYENVIKRFPNKKYEFTITKANDCKAGYEIIMSPDGEIFDFALLDISMPPYPEKGISTGEDLARLINEHMATCKVLLLTMHSERLKAQTIIEEIDPIGLVIKNDLTFDSMLLALETVLKGERYYSDSVNNYLNELQKEKVYIDVFNKRILHFLNKGVKDEDVALYVPLSQASVLDRIEKMKVLIGKPGCSLKELMDFAIENGMMHK